MLTFDGWGPAERLHATIRRRAPQAAASNQSGEDGRYVRVTYRDAGPWTVDRDGETYRWRAGEGGTLRAVARRPRAAAEHIAEGLDLRPRPPGSPAERP